LSKALGLSGRAVDLLDHRGLTERFQRATNEGSMSVAALFPFRRVSDRSRRIQGEPPRFLFVLQAATEQLLADRAHELGVELRRGQELTALEQDVDSGAPHREVCGGRERRLQARFVVGCDGAHSTVREMAGIAFPGTAPTRLLRLGDVKIPGVLESRTTWRDGRRRFPRSTADTFVSSPSSRTRGIRSRRRDDPRGAARQRASHLRRDVPMTEARWLSRFTDASRQAERLPGPGGFCSPVMPRMFIFRRRQDLRHGTRRCREPGRKWPRRSRVGSARSLDSYHAETHPAGARVLMHTRAQGALMSGGEHTLALRQLVRGADAG